MTQGEVDHLPVRLPMIEIRTIGAGGGSIALVDAGGRLTVGPRSAGALPGPVCYGHGGSEPTVTDANLALGRLDPQYFLGGAWRSISSGARRAIAERIAAPLCLTPEEAAEGILTVTNTSLAAAIRLSLFEKGLDPREFALLSFGGAGGLHAAAVADELGIDKGRLPARSARHSRPTASSIPTSSTMSRAAAIHSRRRPKLPEIAAIGTELRAQGTSRLEQDGLAERSQPLGLAADMRYHGQAFELLVPWGDVAVSADSLQILVDRFHALHEQRFSYANPGDPVEIVTLRLTATGRLPGRTTGRRRSRARERGAQTAADLSRRRVAGGRGPSPRRPARADDGPALIEEAVHDDPAARGLDGARSSPAAISSPRPRTEPWHRDMTPLGPIELEVLRNALPAAAAEMDVTIWRTSRITVVRELLDYSTAVFDAEGYNVAQSARIPQHLNSMGAGLLTLCGTSSLDEWQPGDVVITNDPYCGGQHLHDMLAFRPVFHDGQRIAMSARFATISTWAGWPGRLLWRHCYRGISGRPAASRRCELIEGGQFNEAVWAVIRQNVRKPALTVGDLQCADSPA